MPVADGRMSRIIDIFRDMTFSKGDHAPSLKQELIVIKRAVPENCRLGITKISSPCGNLPVRIQTHLLVFFGSCPTDVT